VISLTLPANWLAMIAIMTSSTVIGTTMSFSFPLLSLVLERRGVTPDLIGLNAAAYGFAVFTVAPWLPRIVNRLGAARSMALGQALCIVCLLLFPLRIDLFAWAGLRYLLGIGTVLSWVASESAINALADDRNRGRVIGFYATLFCIGYAAGPVLITLTGSEGFLPFGFSAVLLAIGILPLMVARGVREAMAEPGSARLTLVWRAAPLALGAILTFGLVETSSFALLPLYGLALGYDEAGAAFLLALLIAGNVLFQIPIGWLADRVPRERVLLGCAVLSVIGVAFWPALLGSPVLGGALLVACGGALGGFYTLSMALLGQRFRGADLAVANTAFVLMYQLGAMVGPALGGAAMQRLGPDALAPTLALALMLFVVGAAGGLFLRRFHEDPAADPAPRPR
jgi:MFS family permease